MSELNVTYKKVENNKFLCCVVINYKNITFVYVNGKARRIMRILAKNPVIIKKWMVLKYAKIKKEVD